jgi:hypothetical protein
MTTETKENLQPLNQEIEQVRKNILNDNTLLPETIERVKKAKITKIATDIYSYGVD